MTNALAEPAKTALFEAEFVPHLRAAYNLARWLVHNPDDAEDMVQESYLRAYKYFDGFRGVNSLAWLLTIVRTTCYTWLHRNRFQEASTFFDEDQHSGVNEMINPETLMLKGADGDMLRQLLEELPVEFREALVLRELEGMSYKQIAEVAGIPLGTVMSRLARARRHLQRRLSNVPTKEY
jgi:RNA polymerase sigma-70 factor, ECF subfamily